MECISKGDKIKELENKNKILNAQIRAITAQRDLATLEIDRDNNDCPYKQAEEIFNTQLDALTEETAANDRKIENLETARRANAKDIRVPIPAGIHRETSIDYDFLKNLSGLERNLTERLEQFFTACARHNATIQSMHSYMKWVLNKAEYDHYELLRIGKEDEDQFQNVINELLLHFPSSKPTAKDYMAKLNEFVRFPKESFLTMYRRLKVHAAAAHSGTPATIKDGAVYTSVMTRIPMFVTDLTRKALQGWVNQKELIKEEILLDDVANFVEQYEQTYAQIPTMQLPIKQNYAFSANATKEASPFAFSTMCDSGQEELAQAMPMQSYGYPALQRDTRTSDERRSRDRTSFRNRRHESKSENFYNRRQLQEHEQNVPMTVDQDEFLNIARQARPSSSSPSNRSNSGSRRHTFRPQQPSTSQNRPPTPTKNFAPPNKTFVPMVPQQSYGQQQYRPQSPNGQQFQHQFRPQSPNGQQQFQQQYRSQSPNGQNYQQQQGRPQSPNSFQQNQQQFRPSSPSKYGNQQRPNSPNARYQNFPPRPNSPFKGNGNSSYSNNWSKNKSFPNDGRSNSPTRRNNFDQRISAFTDGKTPFSINQIDKAQIEQYLFINDRRCHLCNKTLNYCQCQRK